MRKYRKVVKNIFFYNINKNATKYIENIFFSPQTQSKSNNILRERKSPTFIHFDELNFFLKQNIQLVKVIFFNTISYFCTIDKIS